MTISAYRVESVLKAYSKQTRMENPVRRKPENLNKCADIVTLSSENNKKEAFDKISYSLVDVLLKQTSSNS
ncbi:MAG: hypothetical protein JRE23_00345 [Deltaproteobacteria bacterium]|nr:hypothetical protein [Deltaproteobacteria bacterium]